MNFAYGKRSALYCVFDSNIKTVHRKYNPPPPTSLPFLWHLSTTMPLLVLYRIMKIMYGMLCKNRRKQTLLTSISV